MLGVYISKCWGLVYQGWSTTRGHTLKDHQNIERHPRQGELIENMNSSETRRRQQQSPVNLSGAQECWNELIVYTRDLWQRTSDRMHGEKENLHQLRIHPPLMCFDSSLRDENRKLNETGMAATSSFTAVDSK